jgi:formylglycine-generating enzyme required for sulfatase activity/cellulose biosynthesis protein BcsQ
MATSCQFVTFYSYKGGVGRTLALANVAWAAALDGKKVVIIDFDLEAPGISSILPFQETMRQFYDDCNQARKNGGLFELILYYQRHQIVPAIPKYFSCHTIKHERFKDNGCITIIPAGKEDKNYRKKLQSFNWAEFYENKKMNGRNFFLKFRDTIINQFDQPDLVCIDSRTGLTDIGGICTILLPDILVVLTGMNTQNLTGTKVIIDSIKKHSEHRKNDDFFKPIKIITVASHIPYDQEMDKTIGRLKEGKKILDQDFDIKLHYVPILSLEERLLVDYHDNDDNMGVLVKSYQKLYWKITQYLFQEDTDDRKTGDRETKKEYNTQETENLEKLYLLNILRKFDQQSLTGIDRFASTEYEIKLNTGAVYTALLTRTRINDDYRNIASATKQYYSALEMLNNHNRLVLLGDPGSGKTSFVNFVAWCLAGEYCCDKVANINTLTTPMPDDDGNVDNNKRQDWDHDNLLPVHIILRDFAARQLNGQEKNKILNYNRIWQYIEFSLEKMGLKAYFPHLKNEIQKKGCLLLLDGMDEVPEAYNTRSEIKEIIENFCDTYSHCRILVTSRIYAYQNQKWRLSGFQECTLSHFSKGQILLFIDQWYTHISDLRQVEPEHVHLRAALLKRAILHNNRLYDLAERPLLLTLMASIHTWRGGSLPEKRETLYADSVNLLLDLWEQPKIIKDQNGNSQIQQPSLVEWLNVDRKKVRNLLNQIAFEAHKNQDENTGTADIPEHKLINGLMALCHNPDIRPIRLIEYLSERAGLIISTGGGHFIFPHRTFQEYLASCYLTDNDFPEYIVALFQKDPNRWREVILLAGAKAIRGSTALIWSLVNELCESAPVDKEVNIIQLWSAHIAAQILVETLDLSTVSPKKKKKVLQIIQWLLQVINAKEIPPAERAIAGKNLAKMGDPRNEVLFIDQMVFCMVPAGPFLMGQKNTLHRNACQTFWIGKYPVTNFQYQQFIQAGGYDHEPYWTNAIKHGKWNDGAIQDDWKKLIRKVPVTYGTPFDLPNHPVVGITWYEAKAFTHWLTEKWHNEKRLPDNWHITLPSELQWEKSARGGEDILKQSVCASVDNIIHDTINIEMEPNSLPKRKYPWGNTQNENLTNCKQTGIHTTSAVGCFPLGASPYGCEELCGNISEWTHSLDQAYPYQSNDGREDLDQMMSPQWIILRGGTYHDTNTLCCTLREKAYPQGNNKDLGFRIIASPIH